MHNTLFYEIALTMSPGIGPVKAKHLVAFCGSAEAVFKEKKNNLARIPDIGKGLSGVFDNAEILSRAEKELSFIEKNHILPYFFTDKKYPDRLKQCEDSPALIYTKGKMTLNGERVISVVGTRSATSYGKGFCKELLEGLKHLDPLVVSGLAYGIDICAHRHCLAQGLQTVGCVAHGLDKIYPAMHLPVALEMLSNGGLISEFASATKMTPELFPMRNRIIAGLADCTVVVETDLKGGSMITAHLTNSYGREVFALPGRYNDNHSAGCNTLIRKNIAAIITSPQDLVEYMNWDSSSKQPNRQLPLFQDLSKEESMVVKVISEKGKLSIDDVCSETNFAFNKLSSLLLELEFKGVVKCLPGKLFELV